MSICGPTVVLGRCGGPLWCCSAVMLWCCSAVVLWCCGGYFTAWTATRELPACENLNLERIGHERAHPQGLTGTYCTVPLQPTQPSNIPTASGIPQILLRQPTTNLRLRYTSPFGPKRTVPNPGANARTSRVRDWCSSPPLTGHTIQSRTRSEGFTYGSVSPFPQGTQWGWWRWAGRCDLGFSSVVVLMAAQLVYTGAVVSVNPG